MPDIPKPLLKRARALRHRTTKTEEIFWKRVRNRHISGLKFRRQVPIHGIVVDFACLAHRLVVEIDGGVHLLPEVQVRDQSRDKDLLGYGYHIMRFSDRAILEELETVVGLIEDYVRNRHPLTPDPSPPKGARGVR
jgi:very-short-patch-repair endonuclease